MYAEQSSGTKLLASPFVKLYSQEDGFEGANEVCSKMHPIRDLSEFDLHMLLGPGHCHYCLEKHG